VFGLHWLDLVVLVGYFIAMTAIGFHAYARVKTQGDYFMGGRRFGKLMMVMFTFGSGTHADTAVGVAAQSFKVGLSGIWYQWMQILTTPFYWLLAPVFRRSRCVTTADFFDRRYGTSFGVLYALYGSFINAGFLGVMLFGSARMIEALTGYAIPLPWAIALLVLTFTVYGVAGGLVAAVWTDFFQGILTILLSVILIPFMWVAVNGREGLRAAIPDFEAAFSLQAPGEIALFWILMSAINSLFSMVAQPHIMANTSAGKSEREGQVGFVGGVLVKRVCTVPWALVGVFGMAFYLGQGIEPDHVFGQAVRDFLPVGAVGLMVASIMASVMSTCDVLMIGTAALLTRNLYFRFLRKGDDEKHMVRFARIVSVGFVAFSVALAANFNDMPGAMRFMWKTVPLIGISFFLGLWWRRANRYGAWASFLAALTALLFGQYVLGLEGNANLPSLMLLYLTSGILAGIVVSLLTPRESQRRLDHFYLTINTPVGQEETLRKQGVDIILE
jgi:Na+/proline symporter